MASYDKIINDVEKAILALIEERLKGTFQIVDFKLEINPDKILNHSSIMVATDKMTFDNITNSADTVKVTTHVYTMCRSAKSVNREEFKRHGVMPIVIGVARLLNGQDFGIDITPLDPLAATEIVSGALAERDVIMFDLSLGWDFEIEETDFSEEDAADLVAIANKWMLDGTEKIVTDMVSVV